MKSARFVKSLAAGTMMLVAVDVVALDVAKEPKVFKGVPWGASIKNAQSIAKLGECTPTDILASVSDDPGKRRAAKPTCSCYIDLDLGAGIRPTAQFMFDKNRLVQVKLRYPPLQYEVIREILVEKYGPPSSTVRQPFQTIGGVSSVNDVTMWSFASVSVDARRYGDRITVGMTTLTAKFWAAELESAVAEAKKKAKTAF